MATLKLGRGGKKASLMNKFKVFIDGDHVGDLKKYGHSAEFVVQSGTRVVTVRAFGGVRVRLRSSLPRARQRTWWSDIPVSWAA